MPPAQSTRVLLLITLAFTMVLLSGSLAAAEDDNLDSLLAKDLDITELLQMQVTTAARKNQTIRNAPSNIITITRQMIKDRGYQNLTQLLQDIPGFDISVGQPAGEYPSNIVFRGISDVGQTKLMLMVDGVIQNDISNGWIRNLGYDFLFIDVERI